MDNKNFPTVKKLAGQNIYQTPVVKIFELEYRLMHQMCYWFPCSCVRGDIKIRCEL